jgi:hypothetical protein
MEKRKYKLTKPRTETHRQNKVIPYPDRMVQIFFSVKGKHYKDAQDSISSLIQEKKWKH